ncbi:MAG: lipopolysaccharide heptosyltransferase II [Gammaproteobacteria bacterium]|nr:lipopolysaccharide heptosyltransferase II [Gammaproteobacteria bacterium]MDH5729090.1 lipopolysaccharide heptosyltransferase II [Gammaproteobacteria bacterium]
MMRNILIVGPAWIGDMVMAQSLFRLLKQIHPKATIDVIAPAWSKPLLARMPEIQEAIELPFAHGVFKPLQRIRLGQSLRDRQYDWAITLPITWKSALVPFGAKIKKRTGFKGEMRYALLNDMRILDKKRLPMMVQRYLALGLDPDASIPDNFLKPKLLSSAQQQQIAMQAMGLSRDKKILGICPGAEYGPAKRWPVEYFADVGNAMIKKGWQVWLFGSEKDNPTTNAICESIGQGSINLAGRTQLDQAIDLLACCQHVLCNDSGLMHISAALGVQVSAIFGSSDIHYTPPLNDNAQMISLQLECSPCFKKECPLGHYNCLKQIKPETVLATIN